MDENPAEMNQDEQRDLETQLLVRGFTGLDDPALVPSLARLIHNHEDFIGALGEVDDCKRPEMYEALRPYLPFQPWPLDKYVARICERASAVASTWAPIDIGEKRYQPVPAQMADAVILTFECCKCTRIEQFLGPTPVQTAIVAREKGWVRDLLNDREICPKCPAIRTKYGRA